MLAWYLIRTKSGSELIADSHLTAVVPEVLLPMLRVTVRRWGRPVKSLVPLFAGYIFARFDFEREYRRVKYSFGVKELVCAGNQPLAVPEEVIETLKRRCANGPVEIPSVPLTSGEVVRVMAGPFRGLEAVFERYLSGVERVAILLSSLEKLQPRVVLRADALERVSDGRWPLRAAV